MEFTVMKAGKCFVCFKLYTLINHKKLLAFEFKFLLQLLSDWKIECFTNTYPFIGTIKFPLVVMA